MEVYLNSLLAGTLDGKSGQLHSPANLPRWKDSPVFSDYVATYVQGLTGEFWEEKSLPVRRIKARFLCCPFCNLGRSTDIRF